MTKRRKIVLYLFAVIVAVVFWGAFIWLIAWDTFLSISGQVGMDPQSTSTKIKSLSPEEQRAQLIANRKTQFESNFMQIDFLTHTNTFRISNGLPLLILDETLSASACAKADHMIANNYWAHVAPDGTEPWYFINQAGYRYAVAGENLAYGFQSAMATIEGWTVSPPHRANLSGDYTEMGVCSRQADNFQNMGYQIVTVAHYAKP